MSKSDTRKRQRTTSGNSDSDSDSDTSRPKNIFADGYDENYRGDANDRAWLKTLSEREREAELLKRHEQREIIKRREEINKRLRSKAEESGIKSEEEGEIDDQDDDSDNDKQNKTSIRKSNLYDNDIYAEDDDGDYASSANRRKQINASKQKETEHSKSLQLLVEGRKKKQDEKNKKSSGKSEEASSSDDDNMEKSVKSNEKDAKWKVTDVYQTSSEDDDDDEDDDDSRDNARNRRMRSRSPDDRTLDSREHDSKRKKCTPISTRDQLKCMILSRFRMEKWCHSPFFPSVAKGAFVRINIGQNNGEPVYRVCEISDVVETGKIYNLGSTRTNKGLRLKHGNSERVFRLEYVSNNEISDGEFQRWREAMIRQGISLPTLDDLEKKMKEIEKCKQYVYNNNDITQIVQEKKRFRKAPINYAMSKNELLKEIEIAKDDNDMDLENELRKQLTEMEEKASELDRKRSENISVMTEINRRNRESTQKNIEMALAREALEHRNAAADPFTRRRCAPTLVAKTPQLNNKQDLIRGLQQERLAAEAAATKKKLDEQQSLLSETNKSTITTVTTMMTAVQHITTDRTTSERSVSSMTTLERGSFTSFSEQTDEMFTSHNFELDLNIKLFSD